MEKTSKSAGSFSLCWRALVDSSYGMVGGGGGEARGDKKDRRRLLCSSSSSVYNADRPSSSAWSPSSSSVSCDCSSLTMTAVNEESSSSSPTEGAESLFSSSSPSSFPCSFSSSPTCSPVDSLPPASACHPQAAPLDSSSPPPPPISLCTKSSDALLKKGALLVSKRSSGSSSFISSASVSRRPSSFSVTREHAEEKKRRKDRLCLSSVVIGRSCSLCCSFFQSVRSLIMKKKKKKWLSIPGDMRPFLSSSLSSSVRTKFFFSLLCFVVLFTLFFLFFPSASSSFRSSEVSLPFIFTSFSSYSSSFSLFPVGVAAAPIHSSKSSSSSSREREQGSPPQLKIGPAQVLLPSPPSFFFSPDHPTYAPTGSSSLEYERLISSSSLPVRTLLILERNGDSSSSRRSDSSSYDDNSSSSSPCFYWSAQHQDVIRLLRPDCSPSQPSSQCLLISSSSSSSSPPLLCLSRVLVEASPFSPHHRGRSWIFATDQTLLHSSSSAKKTAGRVSASSSSSPQQLRVQTVVAPIARLSFRTRDRRLAVGQIGDVGVLAFDEEGNNFTSLQGLIFEWRFEGEDSEGILQAEDISSDAEAATSTRKIIEARGKQLMLSSPGGLGASGGDHAVSSGMASHSSSYHATGGRTAKSSGPFLRSDVLLVRGMKTGKATVVVRLLGTVGERGDDDKAKSGSSRNDSSSSSSSSFSSSSYSHIKEARVSFIVHEPVMLLPSFLILPPASMVQYHLLRLRELGSGGGDPTTSPSSNSSGLITSPSSRASRNQVYVQLPSPHWTFSATDLAVYDAQEKLRLSSVGGQEKTSPSSLVTFDSSGLLRVLSSSSPPSPSGASGGSGGKANQASMSSPGLEGVALLQAVDTRTSEEQHAEVIILHPTTLRLFVEEVRVLRRQRLWRKVEKITQKLFAEKNKKARKSAEEGKEHEAAPATGSPSSSSGAISPRQRRQLDSMDIFMLGKLVERHYIGLTSGRESSNDAGWGDGVWRGGVEGEGEMGSEEASSSSLGSGSYEEDDEFLETRHAASHHQQGEDFLAIHSLAAVGKTHDDDGREEEEGVLYLVKGREYMFKVEMLAPGLPSPQIRMNEELGGGGGDSGRGDSSEGRKEENNREKLRQEGERARRKKGKKGLVSPEEELMVLTTPKNAVFHWMCIDTGRGGDEEDEEDEDMKLIAKGGDLLEHTLRKEGAQHPCGLQRKGSGQHFLSWFKASRRSSGRLAASLLHIGSAAKTSRDSPSGAGVVWYPAVPPSVSIQFRIVDAVSLLFFPSPVNEGTRGSRAEKGGGRSSDEEEEDNEEGVGIVSDQPLLLPPYQTFIVEPWGGSGRYTLTSSDPSIASVTFLPASSSSPPLSSSQLLQPLIWNDSRKGRSAREGRQEGERKGRRESFPSTKASGAQLAHSNIRTTSPLTPRPRFRIETSICPKGGIGKKRRTSGSPTVEISSFSPCYAKLRLEDAAQPRNAFEFYVVLAPIHKVEVHVDSFLIQQQEEGEAEEEEGGYEAEIEEEEDANRSKMKAVATVTAYADLESLRSSPNRLPSKILKWFADQDAFSSSSSGRAQLHSPPLSPSRVLTSLETAASAVRTAAKQLSEDEEGAEEEEDEGESYERKRRWIERHPIHVKTLQFATCPQVSLLGGEGDDEKKKKTTAKDEGNRMRLHVWTDAPSVLSVASLKHHLSSPIPYTCGSYLLRGLNKGKSTLFASLSSSPSSPPNDSRNRPGSSLLTSSVTIDVFPRLEAWVFLDHPFLPLPSATRPPASLQRSLLLQESSPIGASSSSSQQTWGVDVKRRSSSSLAKKKRRHRKTVEKSSRQSNLPIYVEKRRHPSSYYEKESSSIYYGTPVASVFYLPNGLPNDLSSSLSSRRQKGVNRIDEDEKEEEEEEDEEEVLSLALGSSLTFFTRGGPPTRPAVYVQQTRAEVEKKNTGDREKEAVDENKKSRSIVAILPERDSSEYTTIVCLKPGRIPARLLLRTSSIPRKGIDVDTVTASVMVSVICSIPRHVEIFSFPSFISSPFPSPSSSVPTSPSSSTHSLLSAVTLLPVQPSWMKFPKTSLVYRYSRGDRGSASIGSSGETALLAPLSSSDSSSSSLFITCGKISRFVFQAYDDFLRPMFNVTSFFSSTSAPDSHLWNLSPSSSGEEEEVTKDERYPKGKEEVEKKEVRLVSFFSRERKEHTSSDEYMREHGVSVAVSRRSCCGMYELSVHLRWPPLEEDDVTISKDKTAGRSPTFSSSLLSSLSALSHEEKLLLLSSLKNEKDKMKGDPSSSSSSSSYLSWRKSDFLSDHLLLVISPPPRFFSPQFVQLFQRHLSSFSSSLSHSQYLTTAKEIKDVYPLDRLPLPETLLLSLFSQTSTGGVMTIEENEKADLSRVYPRIRLFYHPRMVYRLLLQFTSGQEDKRLKVILPLPLSSQPTSDAFNSSSSSPPLPFLLSQIFQEISSAPSSASPSSSSSPSSLLFNRSLPQASSLLSSLSPDDALSRFHYLQGNDLLEPLLSEPHYTTSHTKNMKSLSILDAFDITSYFGLSSEKSSSASSRGREKTSRNEKTAGNLIFDLPSPLEWPRGMKPCTAACPITSQETWLVPPPLYSMSTSLSSQDRDVDNTENEEADEGRSPSPYHDRGSKKSDGSVEAEVQDRRQGKHEATSFKKKSTLRNLLVLQDEGVLIGENYHGAVHEEEEDRKKRSSQSMTGGGLLETGGETALVEVEFIRIKRLKMFLVPSEDLFSRVGQQQKNHRDVLLSPSKAREVHKKGSTMKDSAGENEEQELEQGAERETGGSSRRMKIRRGRREGGKKRKEEREEDTWGEIEQGRTYGVKIEVYGDDGERLDRNLFRVMNVSLRVTTKRQKSRGRYERISGEPQEYDRKAFSLHEEGGEEEEDDETGGEEEERDDEDGGWVYVQRRFNPLLDGDEDHHTGSSSHLSFSEEDENGRRGEKKKSTKRRRRSRHRREADDVFSGDAEGDQENERKHEEEEEESHEDEEGEEEEENMIGAVASYAVDGNRSAVYPPLQQHEGERRRRRTRDDRSSFISGGDHRTQRSRVEESFPRCFSRRDKSDFPPSTKTDEALAQEEAGEDCPDFFFFANGFDADTEILLIAEALNFSLSFPKSRTSSSSRGGGISSSTGERRRSGRPSIPSFPYDISHRSQARLIASPVRTQMVLALYPPLRLFPSTLVLLPGGHSFQLTVRGGPGSSRRAMIEGILKDERGMKKKKRMKMTTEEGYGDERGKEEEDEEEEEKREGKAERGGSGRVTRRCVSSDPSIVSSLIISSVNMISPGGSLSHGRASLHHQDVVGLYTDTKDGHRNDRNARGEDIVEIVTGREGQARLVVSVSDVDSPRFSSSSLRSLYPRERIAEALVEVIVALPVRVEIREYRGSPSGNYYLDLPHESMMETLQIEKLRQLAKKGLPDETGGSIHSTGNEGLGGVGREQGDERMSKTLETMRGGGEEDRGQGGGGERERSPYLEGEENDERQGKKIRVYVHLTRKLHALLYDEKDREFNFSHLLTPTGTVGGPGLDLQTHEGRRRYQQLGSSETIPPPSATVCTYTWTVLDNDTETDSPPFLLIDPVMRDLYVNETRETCCSTSSSVFLTSPLCLSPSSSDLCTNGLPSNDFLSPEDLLKRRVSGSSGDMTSVSVVGLRQGTARLHLSVSCSPSSADQDRETRSSSKRVVLEKEVSIEVLSSPLFSTRASLTSLAASSFVTPSPSFSSSFHRSPLHVRSPRACKEGLYASPACIRDSSRLRSDFFELDDRGRHEGLLSPPLLLAEFSEYRLPCCSVEIETRSEASFSSSPLHDNKGDLHSSLPRSRISSSSSSSRSAPCPCPSNPSSPTTTVSPSEEEEEHSRPSYAYHRNSTNPHIDHSPGEDPSPKETKHHRSSTPAADRSPSACRCSDSSSPMAMNDEGRDMRRGGETSSFSSNISVLPGGQGLVTFGDHPGLFSRRAGSSPHSSSLDKEREMAFSVSSLRTSLVLTERKKMVSSSLGEGGISRSVHRRQGGREESLGRDEVDEGGEEDISHNKRRRGRRRRRKTSYEEDDWWIGRVEVARVSSISLTKRRKGLPGSRREDDTLFQKGFPALATPSWSSSSLTTIKMTRGDIQQFEVVLHDVYGREILTPNDLRLDVFSSHPSMVSAEVGRHVDSSNMFAPPSIVLYASKVYEGCAAITVFLLSPSSSSGKDVSFSSSRVFLSDSLRVCVDNPSILGPSLPSLPSLEEAWYLSKSLSSFSLEKSSQKKNLDTHALSSSSFSFINIPFIPLFPGSTVRMVDSEKRRRDRGGIVAPTPPQLSIRLFFHLEPLLSSYLLAIRNERHLGEKLREGFFFSFHGNSDSMWVLSKDLRKVAEEILKSTLTTTFSSSSTRCLPISSVAKFTHLLSPYIAQSLHTSLSSLFFSLTSSSSLPFLYTPAFSIDEPLLHFSAIDSSSTTLKRSSSSSTLEYLFSRTQPSSFSPIPFCEVPGGSSSSVPISKGNEEGIRRPEAHAKTASSSSPSTPRFDLFPSSLSFRFSLHDVPGTLATWLLSEEEEEERREKAEKHPRQEDEENHERGGGGGEEQKNRRGIQEEEKKKKMVMIKQFLLRKDTTNELLNLLRRKLSDVWWREQRQMGERTALAYRRCRRKARDILKKRIEVENAREGQSSSMFSSTSSYYSPSRPETSHKKKRDEQERPSSEAPFSSPSSASSRRRERSEEDFGVLSRKKDFGRGRGGIGKTSSSLSLYCEKIADDLYTSSILSPLLFLDWSQGFSPSDPLLSSPSFFSSPSSRRDRSHSGSPGKHRSVSDSPSSLSSASSMQWSSTNDAILQVYTPSGGFRGSSSIPPSESEVYMKASRMRSERLKGANSHHLSDGITAVAAGAGRAQVLVRDLPILNIHVLGEDMIRKTSSSFVGETSLKEGKEEERRQKREEQKKSIRVIVAAGCAIGKQRWSSSLLQGGQEEERRRRTSEEEEEDVHDRALSIDFPPETAWMSLVDRRSEASDRSSSFSSSRREQEKREESPQSVSVSSMVSLPELQKAGKCRRSHSSDSKSNSFSFSFGGFKRTASLGLSERYEDDDEEEMEEGEGRDHSPLLRGTSDHHLLLFRIQADTSPPMRGLPSHGSFQSLSEGREVSRSVEERNEGYRSSSSFDRDQHEEKMKKKKNLKKKDSFQPDDEEPFEKESYEREKTGKKNEWRDVSTSVYITSSARVDCEIGDPYLAPLYTVESLKLPMKKTGGRRKERSELFSPTSFSPRGNGENLSNVKDGEERVFERKQQEEEKSSSSSFSEKILERADDKTVGSSDNAGGEDEVLTAQACTVRPRQTLSFEQDLPYLLALSRVVGAGKESSPSFMRYLDSERNPCAAAVLSSQTSHTHNKREDRRDEKDIQEEEEQTNSIATPPLFFSSSFFSSSSDGVDEAASLSLPVSVRVSLGGGTLPLFSFSPSDLETAMMFATSSSSSSKMDMSIYQQIHHQARRRFFQSMRSTASQSLDENYSSRSPAMASPINSSLSGLPTGCIALPFKPHMRLVIGEKSSYLSSTTTLGEGRIVDIPGRGGVIFIKREQYFTHLFVNGKEEESERNRGDENTSPGEHGESGSKEEEADSRKEKERKEQEKKEEEEEEEDFFAEAQNHLGGWMNFMKEQEDLSSSQLGGRSQSTSSSSSFSGPMSHASRLDILRERSLREGAKLPVIFFVYPVPFGEERGGDAGAVLKENKRRAKGEKERERGQRLSVRVHVSSDAYRVRAQQRGPLLAVRVDAAAKRETAYNKEKEEEEAKGLQKGKRDKGVGEVNSKSRKRAEKDQKDLERESEEEEEEEEDDMDGASMWVAPSTAKITIECPVWKQTLSVSLDAGPEPLLKRNLLSVFSDSLFSQRYSHSEGRSETSRYWDLEEEDEEEEDHEEEKDKGRRGTTGIFRMIWEWSIVVILLFGGLVFISRRDTFHSWMRWRRRPACSFIPASDRIYVPERSDLVSPHNVFSASSSVHPYSMGEGSPGSAPSSFLIREKARLEMARAADFHRSRLGGGDTHEYGMDDEGRSFLSYSCGSRSSGSASVGGGAAAAEPLPQKLQMQADGRWKWVSSQSEVASPPGKDTTKGTTVLRGMGGTSGGNTRRGRLD